MSYAFYNMANYEGNLTTLDLSGENFKTDKVGQIDFFVRSNNLRSLNLANEPMSPVSTIAKVRLHYAVPEFHKSSFPESGADADHPAGVLNESTIDYYLTVSNNDGFVSIKNIQVEDVLDRSLIRTNTVKAALGDDEPIAIDFVKRVTGAYITSEDGRAKFGATITYLAQGGCRRKQLRYGSPRLWSGGRTDPRGEHLRPEHPLWRLSRLAVQPVGAGRAGRFAVCDLA